jgi:hypothetical protein
MQNDSIEANHHKSITVTPQLMRVNFTQTRKKTKNTDHLHECLCVVYRPPNHCSLTETSAKVSPLAG